MDMHTAKKKPTSSPGPLWSRKPISLVGMSQSPPSSSAPASRDTRRDTSDFCCSLDRWDAPEVRQNRVFGDPRRIFERCGVESRCQIDFRQSIFIDAHDSPFDTGD